MKSSNMGFVRIAAITLPMKVGDIDYNTSQILEFARKTDKENVQIMVFPELAVTGYTLGDLFQQQLILQKSKEALRTIALASKTIKTVMLVGLPLAHEGSVYNCAAVINNGSVLGLVPKTYIPGYKEFYEERWFSSARDIATKEIDLFGKKIPIGTNILFKDKKRPEIILGIEICEDLWGPLPPSSFQVLNGANIIANLSASNELVGKSDYRRDLVTQQSARGICGYIYSSCGVHESTTDVVFSGHCLIAEDGVLLNESKRFQMDGEVIINEIDIDHLLLNRERTTSFGESIHESPSKSFRSIDMNLPEVSLSKVFRYFDPHPFTPKDNAERDKRVQEIFSIQTAGLVKRLSHAKIDKVVLGLSGGLDSTLALLVAVRAFEVLKLPLKNIRCFTMPGFGTTKRTKSNAVKLAEALGVSIETVDITEGSLQQFKDIGHNAKSQDVTYQNVQARYRTMILMNKANQIKGIVMGTGDLSEIALGWNTFNGDQISHYNVNGGVPKTLVKYLVDWISKQESFSKAKKVLRDILDTPISPELLKAKNGKIDQKTEDIIGPYELHDFFLYHFVRWASSPSKILFLAERAFIHPGFGKKYTKEIIKKWLRLFIQRFFGNQWKRSVMPDGPKVGSVALSPRGDWRMPSDAEVTLWLKNLSE